MEDEYVKENKKKANYYKRKKIRGSGQQIYIGEYRTTWSEGENIDVCSSIISINNINNIGTIEYNKRTTKQLAARIVAYNELALKIVK